MQRIVVTKEVCEKLARFPDIAELCDDKGAFLARFERIIEPAADQTELSPQEMAEVLRSAFA